MVGSLAAAVKWVRYLLLFWTCSTPATRGRAPQRYLAPLVRITPRAALSLLARFSPLEVSRRSQCAGLLL